MKLLQCLGLMALFFVVAPSWAEGIYWPESDPIVSHPPGQTGGPASDTSFINDSGNLTWQQEADDFLLAEPATLRRIRWYGFYGGTFDPPAEPPPASEEMRVRFYNARPSDGLPGDVLFEESFINPMRTATGESVIAGYPHPEYLYQVDLSTPFSLASNTQYWIEVVQVESPNSHFRWEVGLGDLNGRAFLNRNVTDWQLSGTSDLAFELWTVPEPAAVLLLVPVVLLLSRRKNQRL